MKHERIKIRFSYRKEIVSNDTLSRSKIENLYLEACIKKKVSIFSRLNSNVSFKINGGVAEINGNLDILSNEMLLLSGGWIMKRMLWTQKLSDEKLVSGNN